MTGIASFEGFWASGPSPEDAETLLGTFVQNLFLAAIAMLFLAVALVLLRSGAGPRPSERAPAPRLAAAGPSQHLVTFAETVSKKPELGDQRALAKPLRASIQGWVETDRRVFDNSQRAGSSLFGKHGQPLDLRSLGMESNASLDRGPPIARRSITSRAPIALAGTPAFGPTARSAPRTHPGIGDRSR
jgi:hypothetical protein